MLAMAGKGVDRVKDTPFGASFLSARLAVDVADVGRRSRGPTQDRDLKQTIRRP
jgi:hypothetical protein